MNTEIHHKPLKNQENFVFRAQNKNENANQVETIKLDRMNESVRNKEIVVNMQILLS